MARVILSEAAAEDFRQLHGSAKKIVAQGLKKLEDHPESRGAPLGAQPTGVLTSFRKLVVGSRTYRIVYRVEEDGTICVVVVIAGRADEASYALAVSGLDLYGHGYPAQIARKIIDTAYGKQ